MKFKFFILALSVALFGLIAASPEFQSSVMRVPGKMIVRDSVTVGNGLTITAGGQTITAGGQTITAGGQTITAGGQTITAGGQTITAGGQTVTAGAVSFPVNQEHVGVMSVITSTVPYTPASGTVATIGDGEMWIVHKVFIKTDTNFDCTGNDCTLTIGDGNDADGFITAADANIQTTFTEATGFTAGYYGIETGSGGAYTQDDGGVFVYEPSGADETIDYAIGGTSPAAGSATAYVLYTRVW